MKEIKGDLIELAKAGEFDVITHGCNCQNSMGSGIAVPMKQNFGCDSFPKEHPKYQGDINKLGTIDFQSGTVVNKEFKNWLYSDTRHEGHILTIVNSYTQYRYGREKRQVDYEAMTICMRKINAIFPGKRIGLPAIGAGLGGGDWTIIKNIIESELKDMDVTIVYYNK